MTSQGTAWRALVFSSVLGLTGSLPSALAMSSTASTAAPTASRPVAAAGTVRLPILPNARALPANGLIASYGGSGGRVLRFESGLANVGRGPLEVRPSPSVECPTGHQHATQIIYRDADGNGWFGRAVDTGVKRKPAGCMVFHAAHDHWHFQAAAQYTVFMPRNSAAQVSRSRKMSFCLRDSRRVPERWRTRDYPMYYGACSQRSPQGISTGWVDVYQRDLAGQSIRLPAGYPDGLYCLRTDVDPSNQLRESSDTDNASFRAFRLVGTRIAIRPTYLCR